MRFAPRSLLVLLSLKISFSTRCPLSLLSSLGLPTSLVLQKSSAICPIALYLGVMLAHFYNIGIAESNQNKGVREAPPRSPCEP